MPVARGSRLPVWPALRAWNSHFTRCNAWLDERCERLVQQHDTVDVPPGALAGGWTGSTGPGAGTVKPDRPRTDLPGLRQDDRPFTALSMRLSRDRARARASSGRNRSSGTWRTRNSRASVERKKPDGGSQCVGNPGRRRLAAEKRVVDAGDAEIARNAYIGDGNADAGADLSPWRPGPRSGSAESPLRPGDYGETPVAWHIPGLSCDGGAAHSDRSGHLDAFVAFDLVADLDVAVIAHADAALGSGTNLGHVVLESTE